MSYTLEGYYVNPTLLRDFAAKQNPETPPKKAIQALYDFCVQNAEVIDMEDVFTDYHSDWISALDNAVKKLGVADTLNFTHIMEAETPPFPYPFNADEEAWFGFLSASDAAVFAEKMQNAEKLELNDQNQEEIVSGLTIFRECCKKAVSDQKDMIFFPLDYLEDETDEEAETPKNVPVSSSCPGQFKFFATILALPGIGYYLGAMQVGPLSCGNISMNEFVEKWRKLFDMEVGYFLIPLPLIFYVLILTQIWGKFSYRIRKRLWLGALLALVVSYITLIHHFSGLVRNEGLALLAGAFILWMSRGERES